MDEIYEMEKRKERSNTTAPPGARGHLAPLEAQREKDKEAYLVLKPAVFGVMMPLTLGTESMMPLEDLRAAATAAARGGRVSSCVAAIRRRRPSDGGGRGGRGGRGESVAHQKWLVSASRIFSSKSVRLRPPRTFLDGTRPGALSPGTCHVEHRR